MFVKICGNTTLEDARVAAEAGADMLGFIFYPISPRNVTREAAGEIVTALRSEMGAAAPQMVGVFVDEPLEQVRAIREQVRLDAVQLHGSEPPIEIRALLPRAFKVLRPQNRGDAEAMLATYAATRPDLPDLPDFLLDTYHSWKMGGTGQPTDWRVAQALTARYRILLAGGLTPENVADAIRVARPWGVDVVSGVERARGVKDHDRIRAFVQAAKGTELANNGW